MVVRLRLSPHRRIPSSREIYYRIVVCNAPKARDSKPLETIGAYDPLPKNISSIPYSERSLLDEGRRKEDDSINYIKRVEWDKERVKYWIQNGAQPTPRVAWLLHKANLIPPGRVFHGYRGPPKDSTASNITTSSSSTSQSIPQPEASSSQSQTITQ